MASKLRAAASRCVRTKERLRLLEQWVDRRYRRELSLADLRDPRLLDEARVALDELTAVLGLGARFYEFQGGFV
jgi:succinylarginine dihydrolase